MVRRPVCGPRSASGPPFAPPSPTTFATVSTASSGVGFRQFFTASLAGFLVLTTVLVLTGLGVLFAVGS